MPEHRTPFDYLNGCRLPECVAATNFRVREFCLRTGRPLPMDMEPSQEERDCPSCGKRLADYRGRRVHEVRAHRESRVF